jgi:DNA-binding MarR family transcriptional regulator
MDKTTPIYADQFAEIVRQGIRLKRRFRAVLPEHAAQALAQVRGLLPAGIGDQDADLNLYYELGVILSEAAAPMTMGELSQAVEAPLSTATRIVDSLVGCNYAERLADPADRRVVRVGLTHTGQEIYRTIEAMVRQRLDSILRRFTPEECETLLRLMHKLLDALSDEAG